LVIRCKNCQETIWVQTADVRSATVVCAHCSQEYRLQGWTKLSSAERRLSEDARKLARKEGIDLPGAYSVVLGIMSVEDVQELAGGGSAPARDAAAAKTKAKVPAAAPAPPAADTDLAKDGDRKYRYDPAFRDAVEGGLLTARQALERGKRDSYAAMVATRHRLPIEIAYSVADNRISLLEAMRQRKARPSSALPVSLDAGVARRWAMRGGIAAIAVAIVFAVWSGRAEEAKKQAEIVAGAGEAEITADDSGRVVQIAGPTPGSVLTSFCQSAIPGKSLEALDLVASAAPGSRARLGLLRDPADPDTVLAITIREDRDGGRWIAGDGTAPLTASLAPEDVEKARRSR
jgi:hypothetical protein